jgi:aminopeptidase YwaD
MENLAEQAMAHLKLLSVDIGQRPAGSPENEVAAKYIESVFQGAGLSVERQYFPCLAWEYQDTILELGGRRLESQTNWRSLPCDVRGVIIPVGSLDVLAQSDLSGRIAVLYGDLTQDELSNRDSWVYYPEFHHKINNLLDQKQPAAVITVCPLLQSIRHVIKDPDAPFASATVMPEVGLELLRHAGESIHLHIAARRGEGQACNVIGTRPGSRSERIVLCAHYDTVWGTPGAYDNASGASVLLTLAQVLAERDLPVGLEFYASNGEEFGGQGTIAYIKRYGLKEFPFVWDKPVGERSPVWEPILAVINTDGVGQELGTNNITTIAASEAFLTMVEGIRKEKYPGVASTWPWPASDHYTFYSHGVPSIALGTSGGLTSYHHQPVDTIHWISPAKLGEVVSLVVDLVDALQDKTSDWCRPPVERSKI